MGVTCKENSTDSNLTFNYLGKYFDFIKCASLTRYYFKSADTLEIYEYVEFDTYFIVDKVITVFNSKKLFDIFGVTYSSWNNTGVKPDGSSDYIYFDLEDNLNLNI